MVAAIAFSVASAYGGGKVFPCLGINVPGKFFPMVAAGAIITGCYSLLCLQYVSVLHSANNYKLALVALAALVVLSYAISAVSAE